MLLFLTELSSFVCPNDMYGLHPDPLDCRTFYECSKRASRELRCPPETWFYPKSKRCEPVDGTETCVVEEEEIKDESTVEEDSLNDPVTPLPGSDVVTSGGIDGCKLISLIF